MPTELKCVVCGATFEVFPSHAHRRKTCSKDCATARRVVTLNAVLRLVEKTETCWLWQGSVDRHGYATYGKPSRLVHRYVYEQMIAPPGDLQVLHRCDNRRCVRPEHLFLGTNRDNVNDMLAKGRSLKGERSPRAKLTDAEVLELRRLPRTAVAPFARARGIRYNVAWNAWSGRTWSHLVASAGQAVGAPC